MIHTLYITTNIGISKRMPYVLLLGLVLFMFTSCKKLLEVNTPPTNLSSLNAYEKDATAISAVTALYVRLSASSPMGKMNFYSALSADELILNNGSSSVSSEMVAYYTNNLNSLTAGFELWNNIYPDLYIVNSALEGISNSSSLTPVVKNQLLGEAYFMRAFYFFYLVNAYGDIPLIISTDYRINDHMARTPSEEVFRQIISDLKMAQSLLNENFLDGTLLKTTSDRVRPAKGAATALLARAYLYTKDWKNAEIQSTALINNANYNLVGLNEAFKKNSAEAIWQLQSVNSNQTTHEAELFVPNLVNGVEFGLSETPVFLSDFLLEVFEDGDIRKENWTKRIDFNGASYTYAFKYKEVPSLGGNTTSSECSTIFRQAEQYLIRAEARIKQGHLSEGIADLNVLRTRATNTTPGSMQLPQLLSSLNSNEAIMAVEHERRVELFTEWSHRWLDLKRTERIDEVMTIVLPYKQTGLIWKSFRQWYPIDINQLKINPNLIQNKGY